MEDHLSTRDPAADRRSQMERSMAHLEWLGGRLHPVEQSILLNNLEKFMNDSDNMVARIKRGERPADVFASLAGGVDDSSARPGAPSTESAAPSAAASASRRRRLSSGQNRSLGGSASVPSAASETARRGLVGAEQGLSPANPRKRRAEQD